MFSVFYPYHCEIPAATACLRIANWPSGDKGRSSRVRGGALLVLETDLIRPFSFGVSISVNWPPLCAYSLCSLASVVTATDIIGNNKNTIIIIDHCLSKRLSIAELSTLSARLHWARLYEQQRTTLLVWGNGIDNGAGKEIIADVPIPPLQSAKVINDSWNGS